MRIVQCLLAFVSSLDTASGSFLNFLINCKTFFELHNTGKDLAVSRKISWWRPVKIPRIFYLNLGILNSVKKFTLHFSSILYAITLAWLFKRKYSFQI